MGFFKILKEGFDAAREQVKQNIEEAREQMKQNIEEAREQVKQNIEEARGRLDKQQFQVKKPLEEKFAKLGSCDDEDDEPRIQLGKFENGVLEIREGITKIDDDSLEDYKHLRKIIFPASLEEIDDDAIDDQEELEELDFSRVTKLKTIPDSMVYCETKITQFIIPRGVIKVNDCFLREANPGVKVYVPDTVKEMGCISGNSNNDLIVYLFAHNLDVEEMEQDVKTLYVLPQDYASYARKLKDCESEARLREMPEEALGIYPVTKSELDSEPKVTTEPKPEPKLESQPELKSEPQKEETSGASDDGIFSARLEMLIKSALQDGILTEQERAIILRRAEKEGEDPDEVEMIIEARLAEMKQSTSPSETNIKSESVSSTPKTNVEKGENGGSYRDLLNWKREKMEAAKNADSHKGDSPEAEQLSKDLWNEYEKIKKAIRDGAETIQEVESIISSNSIHENDSYKIDQIEKADEENKKECSQGYNSEKIDNSSEILVVPEGTKEIRKGTYEYLEVHSIVLPSTLVVIEEGAFKDCDKLKNVDFSQCINLEKIEQGIFDSCENLHELDLGNCTKLESICDEAFYYQKLNKIVLPPSLKIIGNSAFSGHPFKEIDFNSCHQLEFIGDNAFCAIDADSIDLSGTNVRHIGENAFGYSLNLTRVVFPESLVEIGREAFKACPLKEIVIPDSVESIGSQAFADNENLERATIGRSAKNYFYENKFPDGPIFAKTPNLKELTFRAEIATYTGAKSLNKVTFCDTVKEIGKWAICECSEIEEVFLPNSVTKIGYAAFAACENLSSIVLPDSITEIAEGAFAKTKLKEIVFPRELQKLEPLGEGLEKLRKLDFSKATKLKVIPEDFIGDDTPKLKEIAIPIGVEIIEECIGGENLDRIFLPPTIKEVEDLHQVNLDIYCYAPIIEELGMMIESIEDAEDACTLYVLPEYVESYKAQRAAEDISENLLIIDVIPEEFRYYYDN